MLAMSSMTTPRWSLIQTRRTSASMPTLPARPGACACTARSLHRAGEKPTRGFRPDDFEMELQSNLEQRFAAARESVAGASAAAPASGGARADGTYDAAYFDSDDDAEQPAAAPAAHAAHANRRKLTDDELFYDPAQDDDDAAWVARHRSQHRAPGLRPRSCVRRGAIFFCSAFVCMCCVSILVVCVCVRCGAIMLYVVVVFCSMCHAFVASPSADDAGEQRRAAAQNQSKGLEAAPSSDAILNCPACMSVLCLDCQQYVAPLLCVAACDVASCDVVCCFCYVVSVVVTVVVTVVVVVVVVCC